MSGYDPTDDLRQMQARLVAEYLELIAASGQTAHSDCLTICAILTHPETTIQPGGM